jgi:hypothetical protein
MSDDEGPAGKCPPDVDASEWATSKGGCVIPFVLIISLTLIGLGTLFV